MTVDGRPLLRLAAQRLAGGALPTAADAARWLTAAQGQDLRGVLTSLALRTADGTSAGVIAAFDAGEIVRSWPMRGTLHVVDARDLRWMLEVTAARVMSGAAARWRSLGIDEPLVTQARDVAESALGNGGRRTREELFALWTAAGIDTTGQRGVHLILRLALSGVVCYGPFAGAKQQLVLLDEWVPNPRRLGRDEGVAEWVLRYFRSHGPATVADFARWTKLALRDCRAGLAVAAPQLEVVHIDGAEHWMDPETASVLSSYQARAEGVFLLPGFDEYVLGYADRSVMIGEGHAGRVVPGNNGMFQHTVVAAGQVVGTWKRSARGSSAPLVATGFDAFPADVEAEIARLALELPL